MPGSQTERVALIRRMGVDLPRARRRMWWWALAGAVAASLLVNVYLALRLDRATRELAPLSQEGFRLREELAQQQEVLDLLRAPGTQVVALGGLKPSPSAQGMMLWQRAGGGVFVADGLPAAPAGKTYQLWAIAGGKPVSAGVFGVDPSGSGVLRVSPLPGLQKVEVFAVTLEPAGGLRQPSGEMYLASQ